MYTSRQADSVAQCAFFRSHAVDLCPCLTRRMCKSVGMGGITLCCSVCVCMYMCVCVCVISAYQADGGAECWLAAPCCSLAFRLSKVCPRCVLRPSTLGTSLPSPTRSVPSVVAPHPWGECLRAVLLRERESLAGCLPTRD